LYQNQHFFSIALQDNPLSLPQGLAKPPETAAHPTPNQMRWATTSLQIKVVAIGRFKFSGRLAWHRSLIAKRKPAQLMGHAG
tara:strand:- start:465 stop:710 length:246 start_codon:yes stop_codon:yes gene_type:complete